jgi:hypothetical protein
LTCLKTAIAILLLPAFALTAKTQDTTHINTDRPDQSDGAYIVHPRVFQVETGAYVNTLDQYNQALVQSTMLRYGLVNRVELRLLFDAGIFNNQYIHSSESGIFPLAVCSKIGLVKEKGWIPDITLSGYLRLPFTASKNIRPAYFSSTGTLVIQHSIGDLFTLACNGGITRSGDDKSISYPVTAVLILAPKAHFSFFTEYYAFFQENTLPSNNIDFGFLYCTHHHIQLDLAFGTTLLPNTKSNFVTLGFSYRFNYNPLTVIECY